MQMIGHVLAKRNLYYIFSAPLSKKRSRATASPSYQEQTGGFIRLINVSLRARLRNEQRSLTLYLTPHWQFAQLNVLKFISY